MFGLAGVVESVERWVSDPFRAFEQTSSYFLGVLSRFNERQRALAQLEKNVIGFGRAITPLQASAAKAALLAEYQRSSRAVAALRAEFASVAGKFSAGLKDLQDIRSMIRRIPGAAAAGFGQGNPASQIIRSGVFLAALGTIVILSRTATKAIEHFDQEAKADLSHWQSIAALAIPDEQKAELYRQAMEAGAQPGALEKFIGKLENVALIAVLLFLVAPLAIRAFRSGALGRRRLRAA